MIPTLADSDCGLQSSSLDLQNVFVNSLVTLPWVGGHLAPDRFARRCALTTRNTRLHLDYYAKYIQNVR